FEGWYTGTNYYTLKKPQMIAMQSFEALAILNFFEIKSAEISAECGLKGLLIIVQNLRLNRHNSAQKKRLFKKVQITIHYIKINILKITQNVKN
ncbi:MAG TPA: hypothetical protein VLA84_09375, partial [Microcoleus sp.]|nr:hypothetical protein [Microcoleus sp.]